MPKIVKDEEIFKAVIRVVSERGYAGASTKQMANAAMVSEMTLFRKFENKAQLVKQAITYILRETEVSSVAEYTGDIHADLLRVVQTYQDSAVKHGVFLAALIPEITRYPELSDLLDKPLNLFYAFGKLISRYQEEGVLKKENPTFAVAALLGPMIYSSMMGGVFPAVQIPPIRLSNHVELFLKGRERNYSFTPPKK